MGDLVVRDPAGFLVLQGRSASPGVACGPLLRNRVDLEPSRAEGAILAAERATPEDIGRILASAGTLTLGGSLLSHVNTLSREFGKPSVSLVDPGAVTMLADGGAALLELADVVGGKTAPVLHEGDVVMLDGDRGVVRVPGGADRDVRRAVRKAHDALLTYARSPDADSRSRLLATAGAMDDPAFAYILEAGLSHRLMPGGAAALGLLDALASNRGLRPGLEIHLERMKASRVARASDRLATALLEVRAARTLELLDRAVRRAVHGAAQDRELLSLLGGDATLVDGLLAPVVDEAEQRREAMRAEVAFRLSTASTLPDAELGARLGGFFQLVRRAKDAGINPEATDALANRLADLVSREKERAGDHLIIPLADPPARERALVGGKAAGLMAIEAALPSGCRVPRGFVITTAAYRLHLLGETGDRLERVAAGGGTEQAISRSARAAILAAEIPDAGEREVRAASDALGVETVAVRSSATIEDSSSASLAGQFDTVLGLRDIADVLQRVRWLWASLWNARALRAMTAAGRSPLRTSQAVLVQEMIDTRSAGVLVTRDPTGRADTLLVNAAWGLGEAISQGEIPGDLYWVCRSTGALLETESGAGGSRIVTDPDGDGTVEVALDDSQKGQPCLDEGQLGRLARLARALEDAAGRAQEVEFGFSEDDTLLVFQVRRVRSRSTLEG
jgi:hypothetical protein